MQIQYCNTHCRREDKQIQHCTYQAQARGRVQIQYCNTQLRGDDVCKFNIAGERTSKFNIVHS